MSEFSREQMCVARVLSDDDKQITLEILKDKNEPCTLEEGDTFFTVLFIRQPPGATEPEVWVPWEQEGT